MPGYASILKQADIFFNLSPTQIELVAGLCQEQTFSTGTVIFAEGAASDELYVIAQGEVLIQMSPGVSSEQSGAVKIATLRRGQSFGEIALVDNGLRSATAKAAQNNTRLLIIPSKKLMALCDTYPQLGYRLMHNLAADLALKVRSTDLRLREELSGNLDQ